MNKSDKHFLVIFKIIQLTEVACNVSTLTDVAVAAELASQNCWTHQSMVEAEGAYVIGRNVTVSERLRYLGDYTTFI